MNVERIKDLNSQILSNLDAMDNIFCGRELVADLNKEELKEYRKLNKEIIALAEEMSKEFSNDT